MAHFGWTLSFNPTTWPCPRRLRQVEKSRNALIRSLRKRGEKETLVQVGLQLPGSSWQLVFPWWVVLHLVCTHITNTMVRCAQIKISLSNFCFLFLFSFWLFCSLFKAEIDSNISISYGQTIDSQIIHYHLWLNSLPAPHYKQTLAWFPQSLLVLIWKRGRQPEIGFVEVTIV